VTSAHSRNNSVCSECSPEMGVSNASQGSVEYSLDCRLLTHTNKIDDVEDYFKGTLKLPRARSLIHTEYAAFSSVWGA
jgi:hypothetical protein